MASGLGRERRRSGWKAGLAAAIGAMAVPQTASADTTFAAGSLIVPMDTDYQDAGMLTAFGLLDKLLRAGVTVNWVIDSGKVCTVTGMTNKITSYTCSPNDMTASATDFKNGAVITNHGYRGGPFVIDASLASQASPIITAWQTANSGVNTFTAVHVATAQFTAPVARVLTAAPRIAVLNDTNQSIAFGYLNAALIPDEKGLAWSNTSVDLLADTAVAGGALFASSGQPAFCEIMTMHWGVNSTDIPGVTAQMDKFLQFPVHVNAECQAVNAIEGDPSPDGGTGGRENFVTTSGFQWPAPAQPNYVQFSNSSLPFAQMDGPFQTTGGSEPSYALAAGSSYYNQDIVMIRGAGMGFGLQDVWMTGYAHGACDIYEQGCNGIGKVSYLGGHQYQSTTPITKNPQSQGARLFLNSLYEAGCVTAEGQPSIVLKKSGPTATANATVTYLIAYNNTGAGPGLNAVLTDTIPAGSTFVSATGGGMNSGGTVTWNLGDLGAAASGSVSLTVTFPSKGTYTNTAKVTYKVGLNTLSATSNQTSTVWGSCGADSDCPPQQVCDLTNSTCGAPADGGASDGGGSSDASGDATTDGSDASGPGGGAGDGAADATTDGEAVDAPADATLDDSSADATVSSDGSMASDAVSASSSGASSSSGSMSSGSGSATSGSSSGSSAGSASGAVSSSGASSGASSGGASGSGSSGTTGDDASTAGEGPTSASAGCSCTQAGSPPGGGQGLAGGLLLLAWAVARSRRTGTARVRNVRRNRA
jgi:uncharacterized repeat protein (TIGR01451 family)